MPGDRIRVVEPPIPGTTSETSVLASVSREGPIRYAYAYRVTGAFSEGLAGAPVLEGTYFEASARADLDYDGQSSIYAVVGTVGADGAIAIVRYERFAGE